jgi:aspartokinase
MKVLKFGGSSIGNAERIRIVREIASAEPLPLVVVVSALQGVTDSLKNISELAAGHNPGYHFLMIISRHQKYPGTSSGNNNKHPFQKQMDL